FSFSQLVHLIRNSSEVIISPEIESLCCIYVKIDDDEEEDDEDEKEQEEDDEEDEAEDEKIPS
ncbi:MAG: hypothetical protein EZS28_045784, partial [Streblomastix strix]